MTTIAVDAMGGDIGLDVTVPAAAAFLRQHPETRLILTGDEARLDAALSAHADVRPRITLVHAAQVVEMDESPQNALKNKKQSSMRLAIEQVKSGAAQAAVSAGNTGALMATARFVLKTLPGIDRPAIAKFLPAANGHLTLVLDLGANTDCTPEQLFQFAVMGSELFGALHPERGGARVGLLNIGTEAIKGTEAVRETFALLQNSRLNFIGNIEGNEIFGGAVDVVVADGFVGNIVLKTIEGAVKFIGGEIKAEFNRSPLTKLGGIAALPALKGFKQRLDPRRFNGAIFLGLRGIVVKSHGGTDATGFAYALEEALHEAKADSLNKIQAGIARRLNETAATEAAA
ncbi:phosphate acyltransferase PlsX [Conchiformibius kuhniae]|uniref:Phosphate acyltransferase n=1 Tax=Conchiformibius kuhniae TaxID=211502 RepID=A0A8T9MXU0_9NEIS|nr:phosphate acyltransferase PlsX [Conchiformibius kuhniae]UOP05695.1 phosphate acyltransferase PlsX [Conchiformibius kuhniae]